MAMLQELRRIGYKKKVDSISKITGTSLPTLHAWSKNREKLMDIVNFGALVAQAIGSDNIEEAKQSTVSRDQAQFIITLHGYNYHDFMIEHPGVMEFSGSEVYSWMGI